MPRLFILSGPDLGQIHSFTGKVCMGRSPNSDVVVHSPSISRSHAELSPEGDNWVLVDLDSSNGVHLGSMRAKRFELNDGDIFRLGEIELRFRLGEVSGEALSPASEEAKPETAPEPPPAPAEPAPAPSEPEDDELFLEEDIDLGVAPSFDSPPPAPSAPALSLGVGGAPPRPAQSEPRRRAPESAARRRSAEVSDRRDREILQFSNHRSDSTAMTRDLSQQPLLIRALAVLLGLGVCAAVFWFAFRGASSLRGETGIELDPGVELEDEY